MELLPIRLSPGQDLRHAIEAAVAAQGCSAAYVLSGMGSLQDALLRLAGAEHPVCVPGPSELLTLAGSVSPDGAHLHATLADARGQVIGGHVPPGCTVRTTAELLLALMRDWQFFRRPDPATGFAELVTQRMLGLPGLGDDPLAQAGADAVDDDPLDLARWDGLEGRDHDPDALDDAPRG